MLSGICDHSFEGVAYGNKSRQKFMSLNLSGIDVVPVPKGSNVAIPYNLYISKGSLNNPITITSPELVPTTGLVTGQGVTEAWVNAVLTKFPDLKRGDQISMYTVAGQTENFTFENAEYPISRFRIARVVLDHTSPINVGLTYAEGPMQFTTAEGYLISVQSMQLEPSVGEVDPIASDSIISRQVNGSWLRSTAIIKSDKLATVFDNDYKNAAIATYAAVATTATSPFYLNQAEPNI